MRANFEGKWMGERDRERGRTASVARPLSLTLSPAAIAVETVRIVTFVSDVCRGEGTIMRLNSTKKRNFKELKRGAPSHRLGLKFIGCPRRASAAKNPIAVSW